MSTKIYNAYKCTLGFPYLHLIINQLREEYSEIIKEEIKKVPHTLRSKCIEHYLEDGIHIYPLKNGDILFQLWKYKLPYKKDYLPTLDLMLTFNKIKDWHYQNQTDPWYIDENLTAKEIIEAEQEYIQRKEDWEEIFSTHGSWIPAENGYFIPFIKDRVELEWDK